MKHFYLLPFLILFMESPALGNVPRQGYLVTLSNMKLTGSIGAISHTDFGSFVEFTNDFGNVYHIPSGIVKGFAYESEGSTHYYESKSYNRRWYFLEVLYKGEAVSLYGRSEGTLVSTTAYVSQSPRLLLSEYWLQSPKKRIFPVDRLNFRKKLRRLTAETAPTLHGRIGEPGYRYKDLPGIIREYEIECALKKAKL
jgi:hypothetical protein